MTSFWTDRQTFVYGRTLSDLLCKKECVLCWTNESINIVFDTGLCTINGVYVGTSDFELRTSM